MMSAQWRRSGLNRNGRSMGASYKTHPADSRNKAGGGGPLAHVAQPNAEQMVARWRVDPPEGDRCSNFPFARHSGRACMFSERRFTGSILELAGPIAANISWCARP